MSGATILANNPLSAEVGDLFVRKAVLAQDRRAVFAELRGRRCRRFFHAADPQRAAHREAATPQWHDCTIVAHLLVVRRLARMRYQRHNETLGLEKTHPLLRAALKENLI